MKVQTERIPESQVLMTIEVEPERLDEARDKALRKLTPKAKVPGFRPGKAPPAMVKRYFGEDRILDEALDALVPVVYREAVEADAEIDPVARPRLVVETTEPLVVKATIPVRPTVDLGDYQAVRVPVEEVTVDEARADETLLLLRRQSATLEPVERAIGWRDIVRMDVRATVDDEKLVEQEDVEVQLMEERDVLFPGFEESILDHSKGETVEFDLAVPDDIGNEKFAGKTAHFTVDIKETKEEVLAELDDEFAKQVGESFESVDALRQRIRDDIQKAEEERRDSAYHDQILTDLVERATIEFPPILLDMEVDRVLHDQAHQTQRGEDLTQYLAAIGKTEDEARADLRPYADARLRRSLVLSQVAEDDKLEVGDDEVIAEIDRMTSSAGPQGGQLRELFESENGRDTIRRNLLTRKTLARLVEIATQDGGAPARPTTEDVGAQPAAPAAGEETETASTKRTSKRRIAKATPAATNPTQMSDEDAAAPPIPQASEKGGDAT